MPISRDCILTIGPAISRKILRYTLQRSFRTSCVVFMPLNHFNKPNFQNYVPKSRQTMKFKNIDPRRLESIHPKRMNAKRKFRGNYFLNKRRKSIGDDIDGGDIDGGDIGSDVTTSVPTSMGDGNASPKKSDGRTCWASASIVFMSLNPCKTPNSKAFMPQHIP